MGQISIQDGEIVFLFSQGKRGVNALPLLASAKDGSITFAEGKTSLKIPLPATADILEYLASANPATTLSDNSHSRRPLSMPAKTILE